MERPDHPSSLGPWRRWVLEHDDRWLFVALYVGLAVVLSLWISLFWLVVVVAGHGVLEWVRQSHLDPEPRGVAARVLWELRLDLALVLFALVLAAYLEVLFGIAGLGGATKLATTGARAGAWARGARGVLLSLDDAAQVARSLAIRRRRSGRSVEDEAPARGDGVIGAEQGGATARNPWRGRWPRSARCTVGFGVACGLLLAVAPLLTPHDPASLLAVLAAELHPWP